MKRVLVSGYIGFNNFGDEAIFKILKEHLKSLNINVSALSASKYPDIKTYNYKNPIQILKAIINCHILISGGGSLLQNKTSNFSLIYYLSIIFLAKLFFRKVIIFAQGIEPIKGKFFKQLTILILKMCDFISIRDEKSQELLKKWNINSTLLSDPVYSLVEKIKICENKKGLLIQLREVGGLNKEFISDLAHIVAKYFDEVSVLILQKEYDEKICSEFINEFKKLSKNAKLIYNTGIESTIDTINSFEYVVSTRLHGLIVSSALQSKTFALSYDDKIKALVEELNIENIDLLNYQKEELNKKLEIFFNSSKRKYKYRKFKWDLIDNEL